MSGGARSSVRAATTAPRRRLWIGIDPGGRENFGIAFLHPDGSAVGECVSCADEALAKITDEPLGVGVDAPLWWSSGPSSDRNADQWIRSKYRIPSGTVQTANSLRGACLVQAAMFITKLRDVYPRVRITEAHPKALLRAICCTGSEWKDFRDRYDVSCETSSEHVRDAVIAAVAAREGFTKRWKLDLACTRHRSEQDPGTYWLAPIHYYWPADAR